MALSGMTGFARVEGALGAWSWAVEARSVNGRNLDTRFRGPPGGEGKSGECHNPPGQHHVKTQPSVNIFETITKSPADAML